LGNYYFSSALYILSFYKERLIKRLLINPENMKFGCYAIWFCFDGDWKKMVVDSSVPCDEAGPLFTKSLNNEFWILLMEKAYAKYFGSYKSI
jgi:calpain-15